MGTGIYDTKNLLIIINASDELFVDAVKTERMTNLLTFFRNLREVMDLFFDSTDRADQSLWGWVVHGHKNVIWEVVLQQGPYIYLLLHVKIK